MKKDSKTKNSIAKKLRKKKIKQSAATIWIGLEILALAGVGVAAFVHNVYGESDETAKSYTVPTEESTNLTMEDIQLPTDLLAESEADDVGTVGTLYTMDYPEEVLNLLADMSAEQKIDAILITTPEQLTGRDNVTIAGDVFKESYAADPVSGLVFSDSNFTSEAEGMKMLSTLRGWARDINGLNLFVGYWGDTTDPAALSDKGINLYQIQTGSDNESELWDAATAANMVSAHYGELSQITNSEEISGFTIARSDDPTAIKDAVNNGTLVVYLTEDFRQVRDGLVAAANDGTIIPEALDSAAGYALTARYTLTQIRPEESEKEPPEEEPKPAAKNTTKKETKKMTPEEEAAAAAAAAQKEAEAALKALQKQAEDAMKAATKQAEEAAKAAQGQ